MKCPKIALVLGGGGSRGLAHVGVLQVLQREQIPIDMIVGTSMGGIVGAAYALGMSPGEIARGLQAAMSLSYPKVPALRDLKLFSARARQDRFGMQLKLALGDKNFSDLRIPIILMAVDMLSGKEIQLKEGALVPALLATSAVPGLFPPVVMGRHQLADGGVIDSLATHVAHAHGARKIIAVDVHPPLASEDPWHDPVSAIVGFQLPIPSLTSGDEFLRGPTLMQAMWRSVRVMTWHLHEERLINHPPTILMRPDITGVGSLDFKDLDNPIAAGVAEAEKHLPALRQLLADVPQNVP
ncbi:MAG: patatin-like phospholipase family protein [Anaerolineales bacterium]|nr:patatin-like phospholipase family protein [Anaerolineales bacterium]MCB8951310.1 patatin-like phospholipase family protein [Ardenticatenales bacterium]